MNWRLSAMSRSTVAVPLSRELFKRTAQRNIAIERLPSGRQPLHLLPGHAVPTRRVLSARRVRYAKFRCRRRVAPGKTPTKAEPTKFFIRALRKASWMESERFDHSALGRSHRSSIGKNKLSRAIDRTHALLRLPADYRLAIVPGSDTGAMEMALWSLLGTRPVTVLAWESFGSGWATDIKKQLKLDADIRTADYGKIARLSDIDPKSDILFTWNGTTSGVRVPDAKWIASDRAGLSICDATSAAFAQDIDWAKIDVGTFSWQKALGGEAAHGMLVLSPRAVERLEREPAPRPLPKIFRLTKGGKLIDGIFRGETINTPSMLCVEDWLLALDWAEGIGGLEALIARADANYSALDQWVRRQTGSNISPTIHRSVPTPRFVSNSRIAPTSKPIRFVRERSESCSRRNAQVSTSPPIAMLRPGFEFGAAQQLKCAISKRLGRGSTGPSKRPPPDSRTERFIRFVPSSKPQWKSNRLPEIKDKWLSKFPY